MNCFDVYQNLTCVYDGYLFIYTIVNCVYLKYKEFYKKKKILVLNNWQG